MTTSVYSQKRILVILKVESIRNAASLNTPKIKQNAAVNHSNSAEISYGAIPASCYRANFSPVSFGSRHIEGTRINLKDSKTGAPKKALFVKMDEKKHRHLFEKLKVSDSWRNTDFGSQAIEYFLNPHYRHSCDGEDTTRDTYAVMLRTNTPKAEKEACLMDTERNNYRNIIEIKNLQKTPGQDNITGAGTMAIYSLVKEAKKEGRKLIQLETFTAPGFYEKLGLEKIDGMTYYKNQGYEVKVDAKGPAATAPQAPDDVLRQLLLLPEDKPWIIYCAFDSEGKVKSTYYKHFETYYKMDHYKLDNKDFDSFIARVEAKYPQN